MNLRRPLTLLLCALSLASPACRRAHHDEVITRAPPPAAAPADAQEEAVPDGPAALSFKDGFAGVVRRVAPAVVNVASVKVVHSAGDSGAPFFDLPPPFRDFFGFGPGRERPRELKEQAIGSGVIVSKDGYVLTNNHVVEGASEVRVTVHGGRELRAKIVGTDPKTDIALIRIPGDGFAYATFADSSKVEVGQFALAFGDPLALGQTVTQGIISAKGRGNVGLVDYEDFLQTDAAINPGNSGGPLIDVAGEIIGINTAIATSGGSRGNQGIGFAVPSNLAREVMDQIEQHGHVIRGWLGVAVQDVTPPIAQALGLPGPGGALVGDVTPDSPAAKAGLQRGDVILSLDGKPVDSSRSLRMAIAESAPGTRIAIEVLRSGKRLTASAVLGELPGEQPKPPQAPAGATTPLGVQVAPITPELARRLNLPEGATGVAIVMVQPGSRAAEAGLRPGDVVEEVDRAPVHTPEDLKRAIDKAGDKPILLLVMREGHTAFVVVPAEGS